jgi:SAM-dependent methyltransferase
MISLILYGRNDNHGYNLHKRAAISLNAMAEMLTDADDEILFVDYNTPDDLPTFIEAIGDTLTPLARERLRVFRVRPSIHERYRNHTHLLALESVSRNVALRRANPANRWVLSTNTDMIFVPHETGDTLTAMTRELADGFYQLPRFELPESLWEAFDRRDGAGIINRTRELARRFHLDEIVYGSDQVLYDGPGDFQLCLREDLIRIHGFHEGMLRGWHVDANLCARMIALRGEIKSLAGKVAGYHCDHTRQVTSAHGHDRVENDADAFIQARKGPGLPEQADAWGLPNDTIEEIRIGRGDVFARYLSGLEAAVTTPQTEKYESSYRSETFNELGYRRSHVLPFVIDLLAAYPAGTKVLYAGARVDMGAGIAAACKAMGTGFQIIAPSDFAWLGGVEGVTTMSQDKALAEADILIFEFGVGEPGAAVDGEAKARLSAVRRVLLAVQLLEQSGSITRRRRVMAINAIHNEFESLITGIVAFTLTPFSSHIRHGYILPGDAASNAGFDVRSFWRDIQRSLGRQRSLPLWETQELSVQARAVVDALPSAPMPTEALVSAEYLTAVLRHHQVEQACGAPVRAARAAAVRLELERPGLAVRRALGQQPGTSDGARSLSSLSRVIDMADWEKPAFANFVDRHFGGPRSYGAPDRNPWTWERATILDVLSEARLLKVDTRVLLVTTVPDQLAGALADYTAHAVLARARGGAGPFITPVAGHPDPHGFDQSLPNWTPDQRQFDVVIFLQQSLMLRGPKGASEALEEAARLLGPGGCLIASASVALAGQSSAINFRLAPLVDGSFAAGLASTQAGLAFCGPLEANLTSATCDRVIDHVREDLRYRRMIDRNGKYVGVDAVLTFRRTDAPAAPLNRSVLARVIEIGIDSDIRFQFRRGVRFAQRVIRRLRWELDRRRAAARRRL